MASDTVQAAKAIELGLATAIGAIGPGIGVGFIFGKTIEAVGPPARDARSAPGHDVARLRAHRGDRVLRPRHVLRRVLDHLLRDRSMFLAEAASPNLININYGSDGVDAGLLRGRVGGAQEVRLRADPGHAGGAPQPDRGRPRHGRDGARGGPADARGVPRPAGRGAQGGGADRRGRPQGDGGAAQIRPGHDRGRQGAPAGRAPARRSRPRRGTRWPRSSSRWPS